jgi:hypothetical protein
VLEKAFVEAELRRRSSQDGRDGVVGQPAIRGELASRPAPQLVIGVEHGREIAHLAGVRSGRDRFSKETLGKRVVLGAEAAIGVVLPLQVEVRAPAASNPVALQLACVTKPSAAA